MLPACRHPRHSSPLPFAQVELPTAFTGVDASRRVPLTADPSSPRPGAIHLAADPQGVFGEGAVVLFRTTSPTVLIATVRHRASGDPGWTSHRPLTVTCRQVPVLGVPGARLTHVDVIGPGTLLARYDSDAGPGSQVLRVGGEGDGAVVSLHPSDPGSPPAPLSLLPSHLQAVGSSGGASVFLVGDMCVCCAGTEDCRCCCCP
jgi:hypothetical protein